MSGGTAPPEGAVVAADSSDLCTACGLCCDGTLYGRAKAYEQDRAGLAAHGLAVVVRPGGIAFPLPCPRLEGTRCTIYADRFTTCRTFRCALLQKLDRGTIDIVAAHATIASARTLLAAVEPGARTVAERLVRQKATAAWKALPDPAERIATARRHLAIVALERYLTAHFRHPRGGEDVAYRGQRGGAANSESSDAPARNSASTRLRPS